MDKTPENTGCIVVKMTVAGMDGAEMRKLTLFSRSFISSSGFYCENSGADVWLNEASLLLVRPRRNERLFPGLLLFVNGNINPHTHKFQVKCLKF